MLEPISILTICSLTLLSPGYDCSDTWIIEIYDEIDLGDGITCQDTGSKYITLGCAKYGNRGIVNIKIGSYNGLDDFGFTVLQHEIQHVLCACNFHR